jgi:hypothetical protein
MTTVPGDLTLSSDFFKRERGTKFIEILIAIFIFIKLFTAYLV